MQDVWNAISAVASVATAIALLLGATQLLASRKQRHREFELLYVQRYWFLVDGLTFDIGCGVPLEELSEFDRLKCRQYIRLCEDELDLRKQKFVTDETWDIWKTGIGYQLQISPFIDLIQDNAMPELVSLKEFYDVTTGVISDPLRLCGLKRRWLGLL